MAIVAMSIFLIPPDNIMDICISVNHETAKNGKDAILFNRQTRVPHITLAHFGMEEHDIPILAPIVEEVARTHSPVESTLTELREFTKPDGKPWSEFIMENTPGLQKIHEDVATKVKPSIREVTSLGQFQEPERDQTPFNIDWVNGMVSQINREAHSEFRPHITLCCTHPIYNGTFPIPFAASSLAVGRLGDHCTITSILKTTQLT